ncbi:hypothetical protein [Archangium sp.]|uniref:hypothetical protein n=1 Tax=Archangium sp. TaxID=1872627 RepID=UPI00286D2F93|nr:hypothetical protein [Archangium sp.]
MSPLRNVSGRAWRALLLTLGLSLPAEAAEPCTPEALFLGQGQRDLADASELLGGDGVPDLVLAVRGCRTHALKAVELSAEDGTVLWDAVSPRNGISMIGVATRQDPNQLLQDASGELLPSALTTPRSTGVELVLSVSGAGPRGQAFLARPQGKVILHYAEGGPETIPVQPAPTPLAPPLAALTGPVPLDAAAVLQDFASEDEQRQLAALPRLSEAVARLGPRESLPILKRSLLPEREGVLDEVSAAAARAMGVLGPRALPVAPALVQSYVGATTLLLKTQVSRALSAIGPEAALALTGLPPQDDESWPWSERRELLEALEPSDQRLVWLLRSLGSKDPRAARIAAEMADCEDTQVAFLTRAAKTRTTLKEAWRLLNHPTPRIRHLAAGILLAAGERGPVIRREAKWGARDCGEDFASLVRAKAPEDPKDGVFLALGAGNGLLPQLVYRRGGWEPVLPGLVTGPSEWFPILSEAPPVRTRTKAVEYPAACNTRYWALPLLDHKPPNTFEFALSRKTESRPIPPASAELQSAIQGVLKAHAPAEHRLLAKSILEDVRDNSGREPTTVWSDPRPPQDAPARCLLVTEAEWLCHTTQGRELRSKSEPARARCQSRFWLRGSATAMRLVQSSRQCVTEVDAVLPPVVEAQGALILDGEAWWLMSVVHPDTGGIGNGHELWGPRGDTPERVSDLFSPMETCD